MGAAGLLSLLCTLGCGSSNAERPYSDAGAPGPGGAAAGAPAGGASGPSGGSGSGGAAGTSTGGTSAGGSSSGGTGPLPSGDDAGAPPGGGDGAGGLDGAPTACTPEIVAACDAPAPEAPARRPWHSLTSALIAAGGARHRGHDLFLTPQSPQWLIARVAYGLFDAALPGEEVDVFLLRGCGNSWEKLGTAIVTGNGEHAPVEGVPDPGGRVYFPIPADKRLALGRHRVRFVVAGDGSATEAFVEVRAAGTAVAVIDVDGTLTTSESAEFGALLTGKLPTAEPEAARALSLLPGVGYRLLYLTARPEWLTGRTREFLSAAGFPPGIVETTAGGSGALGADAARFKTEALARLAGKGLRPALAIGNTDTDAEAYAAANIEPAQRRIFLRFTDSAHGGRRIEGYGDVLADFSQLCP